MATHLAASLKVVASHQNRRRCTVQDAQNAVKRAALAVAQKTAGPDTDRLVAALEKQTGAPIAELAVLAEDWLAD